MDKKLNLNTYKIDVPVSSLKSYFRDKKYRCKKILQDNEEFINEYSLRVPVYKYNGVTPLISCDIKAVQNSNEITFSITDITTNDIYLPYYNREFGNYSNMINIINKNINRIFKELSIVKCQKK